MRLQAKGIDNNDGGVRRVGRTRELSNNNVGVGRGRRIYDASEKSEITTEATGARRQAQVIYNNDRVVGGGR